MQAQYLNETHNQLNKLRILCSVKDRKAAQLQSLCEEFREKYENDTQALQHQLQLSESRWSNERQRKTSLPFPSMMIFFSTEFSSQDQNMISNNDINYSMQNMTNYWKIINNRIE